ncbi:MAG: hypothetical protein JF589_06545 [Gemmatimonadetes bacterium]|jgi:hypothetical protein|nr:hypothetical protein [Gemmatimonadota bacterium]
MTLLLWIAIGLVVLWLVVKFVFKVVGCAIHLLLLAALVALVLHFLR